MLLLLLLLLLLSLKSPAALRPPGHLIEKKMVTAMTTATTATTSTTTEAPATAPRFRGHAEEEQELKSFIVVEVEKKLVPRVFSFSVLLSSLPSLFFPEKKAPAFFSPLSLKLA